MSIQMESQISTSRLRRVIALHFDREKGSPYWLEKQQELDIDAIKQIDSVADLAMLGPMDSDALASRPIEDFVPASRLKYRNEFIIAETGGTLGNPKFAVHWEPEFQNAFVEPFVAAAKRVSFPQNANWLYIGPTGPHIIGKAVRQCAKALGSPDPFTVDFDPRWAKILVEGSFAAKRYLKHIEDQALRIIETQQIAVLFSTPPVLQSLAEQIDSQTRNKILGLHLGGMSVTCDFRDKLMGCFPNAVILSGYGNTLFGMAPELAGKKNCNIDYYPHGQRIIFQFVDHNQADDAEKIKQHVDYGQRGQIVVHRLDEVQFIANMIERDTAIRIPPISDALDDGFVLDGLRDPQPIIIETAKPALGLY